MISWESVWAIVLRHVRLYRRDPNIILGVLYWPLLDIITWGFLGAWIEQSRVTEFHNYTLIALLGILLWQIVGRGCNIMVLTLAEELWSNNVITLFCLPLSMSEWMCGSLLFSGLMMGVTTTVCMCMIPLLYDIPLGQIMYTFLLFMPPLFLSSIWLGFSALSILVTLGKRGSELGFVLIWFLLPFSGAYYPIEVLPSWGQALAAWLPMSYVFAGMRTHLATQEDPTVYLIKGYALATLYALCAVLLFLWCFEQSKKRGLARLTQ